MRNPQKAGSRRVALIQKSLKGYCVQKKAHRKRYIGAKKKKGVRPPNSYALMGGGLVRKCEGGFLIQGSFYLQRNRRRRVTTLTGGLKNAQGGTLGQKSTGKPRGRGCPSGSSGVAECSTGGRKNPKESSGKGESDMDHVLQKRGRATGGSLQRAKKEKKIKGESFPHAQPRGGRNQKSDIERETGKYARKRNWGSHRIRQRAKTPQEEQNYAIVQRIVWKGSKKTIARRDNRASQRGLHVRVRRSCKRPHV